MGAERRRRNPFWEGDLWDCANVKSSCAPLLFSQGQKEEAAGCRPAKLHVDFIVNCIKRLHIKNFIYHLRVVRENAVGDKSSPGSSDSIVASVVACCLFVARCSLFVLPLFYLYFPEAGTQGLSIAEGVRFLAQHLVDALG